MELCFIMHVWKMLGCVHNGEEDFSVPMAICNIYTKERPITMQGYAMPMLHLQAKSREKHMVLFKKRDRAMALGSKNLIVFTGKLQFWNRDYGIHHSKA